MIAGACTSSRLAWAAVETRKGYHVIVTIPVGTTTVETAIVFASATDRYTAHIDICHIKVVTSIAMVVTEGGVPAAVDFADTNSVGCRRSGCSQSVGDRKVFK